MVYISMRITRDFKTQGIKILAEIKRNSLENSKLRSYLATIILSWFKIRSYFKYYCTGIFCENITTAFE